MSSNWDCRDCGQASHSPGWLGAYVSDKKWAEISTDGTNVLCIKCMASRAAKLGITAEVIITSGAMRTYNQTIPAWRSSKKHSPIVSETFAEIPPEVIGAHMRTVLGYSGYSYREAAQAIGVPTSTLRTWAAGVSIRQTTKIMTLLAGFDNRKHRRKE